MASDESAPITGNTAGLQSAADATMNEETTTSSSPSAVETLGDTGLSGVCEGTEQQQTAFTEESPVCGDVAMATYVSGVERDAATTCPDCCKPFRVPRLLDCLHTVCEDCLRSRLHPGSWMLDCPVCKQETKLPPAGYTVIPMNWVANSRQRQQFAMVCQGPAVVPMPLCEECIQEEENPAVSTCIECRVFLCDMHSRAHKRSRHTKTHSLIEQDEKLPGEEVESEFSAAAVKCGVHPHRNILGFCNDCQRVYCVNCLNLSHRDHNVVELEPACEQFRAALQDKHTGFKSGFLSDFQLAVKEIDNTLDNLEDRSHEVSSLITDWVQKRVVELRSMEKKLIERAAQLRADREAPLARKRQELCDLIDKASHCADMGTAALSLDNGAELLDMYVTINNRMEALEAKRSAADVVNFKRFDYLQFFPNQQLRREVAGGIGEVSDQPASAQLSAVMGVEENKAVECGKEVRVTFQLRACTGEMQAPGVDEDCIKVNVISPNKFVLPSNVTSLGRGLHRVCFQPAVFGEHSVDVQLDGVPIAASPYPVTVPLTLLPVDGLRFVQVSEDRRSAQCTSLGDTALVGCVPLRNGCHRWKVKVSLPASSPLVMAVGVIALCADSHDCKLYRAMAWRSDRRCSKGNPGDNNLVLSPLDRWLCNDELALELDFSRRALSCTQLRTCITDTMFGVPAVVRPFFFIQDIDHTIQIVSP